MIARNRLIRKPRHTPQWMMVFIVIVALVHMVNFVIVVEIFLVMMP